MSPEKWLYEYICVAARDDKLTDLARRLFITTASFLLGHGPSGIATIRKSAMFSKADASDANKSLHAQEFPSLGELVQLYASCVRMYAHAPVPDLHNNPVCNTVVAGGVGDLQSDSNSPGQVSVGQRPTEKANAGAHEARSDAQALVEADALETKVFDWMRKGGSNSYVGVKHITDMSLLRPQLPLDRWGTLAFYSYFYDAFVERGRPRYRWSQTDRAPARYFLLEQHLGTHGAEKLVKLLAVYLDNLTWNTHCFGTFLHAGNMSGFEQNLWVSEQKAKQKRGRTSVEIAADYNKSLGGAQRIKGEVK